METDQPSPAKKVRNEPKKSAKKVPEKADYAGLEVKKGTSGKLQKPRHSGAKVRARDKGTDN